MTALARLVLFAGFTAALSLQAPEYAGWEAAHIASSAVLGWLLAMLADALYAQAWCALSARREGFAAVGPVTITSVTRDRPSPRPGPGPGEGPW